MNLLQLPKELIINIIEKTKKEYYMVTYGNTISYVCGDIKKMYEKVLDDENIKLTIIRNWIYHFEKNYGQTSAKLEKFKADMLEAKRRFLVNANLMNAKIMDEYVIDILEKYPTENIRIDKISFYGENPRKLYKLGKKQLIVKLLDSSSMTCYRVSVDLGNECYFYAKSESDILNKIDNNLINKMTAHVKKRYNGEELRFICNNSTNSIRISYGRRKNLQKGERIVPENEIKKFIKAYFPEIIKYHIQPHENSVMAIWKI